jgi:hypothetical protein
MKLYQKNSKLTQIRRKASRGSAFSKPFINPILTSRLKSQGVSLQEKDIEVLKLGRGDLIKLGDAGIFTLEQLTGCIETAVTTIPHFGKIKISRLRAKVLSYLTSLLSGGSEGFDQQYEQSDFKTIELAKSKEKFAQPHSTSNFISDLEGD